MKEPPQTKSRARVARLFDEWDEHPSIKDTMCLGELTSKRTVRRHPRGRGLTRMSLSSSSVINPLSAKSYGQRAVIG